MMQISSAYTRLRIAVYFLYFRLDSEIDCCSAFGAIDALKQVKAVIVIICHKKKYMY